MLPLDNVLLLDMLILDDELPLGSKLLLLPGDVLLLRNTLLLDSALLLDNVLLLLGGVQLLDVLLKMLDRTDVLAALASGVLAVLALRKTRISLIGTGSGTQYHSIRF